MPEYPEHDRVKAVKPESQAIGQFIEWLEERGKTICTRLEDGEYWPHGASTEKLLAEYFEIDLAKLEREKEAILADFRAATAVETAES